jgi:hypothetical protein
MQIYKKTEIQDERIYFTNKCHFLNILHTSYKNMLKEKLKEIYRKIGIITIIMAIVLILKQIIKMF